MKNHRKVLSKLIGTFLLLVCMIATAVSTVFAAGTTDGSDTSQRSLPAGLVMSTDYPGVQVKAGDSVSFTLNFSNGGSGQTVSLSASGLPDGFNGYFQGGTSTITSVYVQNGFNDELATYTVDVPDDVTQGTYTVTLQAAGATETSTLQLSLTISDANYGSSKITTDYSSKSGTAGSALTYTATIENNSTVDQTYSLSADAPEGWDVSFAPSDSSDSSSISSIDVEASSDASVTVSVTPPENAQAGDYEIPISVNSENEQLSTTLKATISGNYGLQISTQNETLSFDVRANSESSVVISVANTGNTDLSNISLSASAPTDWTVEFSSDTIDSLAAGETQTVTAKVTPSESAISGDYSMTITATTDDNSTDAQFRVTVKTSTGWGVICVIIIAAIAGILYAIFKKFGRH